jgi:tRNA modification GTPase
VIFADTAGLRDSDDPVEQEGLRRARARAEAAPLRLYVFDAGEPSAAAEAAAWRDERTLVVANKCDLVAAAPPGALPVSALTGAGIAELVAALSARVAADYRAAAPLLTRARHREALLDAAAALRRAPAAELAELRAEDVRLAWRALGRITGHADVEDLLDAIFADFCLGK